MATEITLNRSQSDFSDASNISLGRSTQAGLDDSSDAAPLLGISVHGVQAERREGSSWYASVFLVVNAALGAGLLNFPYAYHQCGGIVVAITIQAILAVFILVSMIVLIYCAQVHNSATYQDVVYACCGRTARNFCSIAVAVYSFGTCITFLIIIGDQWDQFLSLVYGATYCHKWYMTRYFTISASAIVVVLPMCFPRRIDFLKYASGVGAFAVLYCVLLVSVRYFTNTPCGTVRHKPEAWMDVFTVVPVICFGYQCHVSLVPIFACTRDRRLSYFTKTIVIALVLCILSYTVTASFGYLTFGSCIQADILSSYRPTPDVLIAVIIIAIKMYTTYPILLYVGRVAIDSLWLELCKQPVSDVDVVERRRRIMTTVIWFIISLVIALFLPDIGVVISLLGGLAAIFIFVFPGICLLQLLLNGHLQSRIYRSHYAVGVFVSGTCIVLGTFIFGLTTTQSLMKDFDGHNTPHADSSTCP